MHKVLNLPDFNLSQCLFGEHLLISNKVKPVAIVESEKTAIMASVYLPEYIWVATGGCGNLSVKLCESLHGRNVVLFPDAGKFDDWNKKVEILSPICTVSVSSVIEQKATDADRKAGVDLADYLVKQSLSSLHPVKETIIIEEDIIPESPPFYPIEEATIEEDISRKENSNIQFSAEQQNVKHDDNSR
jgi:hypothetical protein